MKPIDNQSRCAKKSKHPLPHRLLHRFRDLPLAALACAWLRCWGSKVFFFFRVLPIFLAKTVDPPENEHSLWKITKFITYTGLMFATKHGWSRLGGTVHGRKNTTTWTQTPQETSRAIVSKIAQCFKTQGLDKWASYILLLISTNNPLEVSIMILSSSYGPSSRSPVKYQLGKCRFPGDHPACCNVTCTELDSRMAFPRGHFLHLKTFVSPISVSPKSGEVETNHLQMKYMKYSSYNKKTKS